MIAGVRADASGPGQAVVMRTTSDGVGSVSAHAAPRTLRADAVILALGGASWPRTGSNGEWAEILRAGGINVAPLVTSNCGYFVSWSPVFAERFAGQPVKNVGISIDGHHVRGELMITRAGIEGGALYAVSRSLREAWARDGAAGLEIDLRADVSLEALAARLARPRGKQSVTSHLRKAGGLTAVAIGLLRESAGGSLPTDAVALATLVKRLPLRLDRPMPIERAISSAGGLPWAAIDDRFMLRQVPGVFVCGEMIDWDAPTGGYLLQATFSTAVAAARGAVAWLEE